MRVEPTAIGGVDVIHWDVVSDARGGFARTFCEATLADAGIEFRVVQANVSFNDAKHTLRGIHVQKEPHAEPKIVSCSRGRIFDVAVDLRPCSPTYRRWLGFELGADLPCALHLAAGIGHGFLTLEADTVVHYLMGAPFVPEAATGMRWNDPAVGINWPGPPQVISQRDADFPLLDAGA